MAVGANRDIRVKAIERAWLDCATAKLLRGVSPEVMAECRWSFYMGAKAILDLLHDGDSRAMDGVRAEIELYFSAMRTQ